MQQSHGLFAIAQLLVKSLHERCDINGFKWSTLLTFDAQCVLLDISVLTSAVEAADCVDTMSEVSLTLYVLPLAFIFILNTLYISTT